MKKTKVCLCALTAVASVGVISAVALNNANVSPSKANDIDYTLVFDKDHVVTDAKITTPLGNDIWMKANYNLSFTSNGLEFTQYGYIQNTSRLKKIKSLTFANVSGNFEVSYGYVEPSDLKTPQYSKGKVSTTTSSTTIDLSSELPYYFRVQAIDSGTSTIESLSVTYACEGTDTPTDDKVETVQQGIENVICASSYNKGTLHYETTDVCQNDFTVSAPSKRALKITNHTKNESIAFVDKIAAVEAGLDLSSNPDYLIFDVKSNNSKVGTTSNPFMISGDVTNNDYKIGWQDPTGYIKDYCGNTGWHRFYWEIKSSSTAGIPSTKIPFDVLKSLSFIPTQNIEENEYFIIDNIHFGSKPVKTIALTPNVATTLTLPRVVELTETLYVDILFTGTISADVRTQFVFRDSSETTWQTNFGYYRINSNGTLQQAYSGISISEKRPDGYYRLTIDASKLKDGPKTGEPINIQYLTLRNNYSDATGFIRVVLPE